MTFGQEAVTLRVSDCSHQTALHQPRQLQSYHNISAVCPSHALRLASAILNPKDHGSSMLYNNEVQQALPCMVPPSMDTMLMLRSHEPRGQSIRCP